MKLKVILFSLLLASSVFAQEVVDRIVAVVDDEIILKSELDFHLNMLAAQKKIDPDNPGVRTQVLNSLVEEKLVLAKANIDSVVVTPEEVEQRLDYQINLFIQQYGSREKVEQMYGMSIEKIKRESREDVRKQILIQRLREKNFMEVESSRREVEEFFIKYEDSLGVIPEKVTISHIFRNPKASDKIKEKSRELAQAVLDSIKAGQVDFAEMATRYSEDPGSVALGGDLGFVKKGIFYPEFEAAAFALSENELSSVVETPVGFHIIQTLEKRGESIKTRHILIKIKNDEEADLRAIEFLTDVRDSILQNHGSFSEYAKKYSEDEETKAFGGSLGSFYMNQLDKNLLDAVSKLKEGEISYPKRIEYAPQFYGYHIVYLKEKIPQHHPSLKEDYNEIKKLADEFKKQKQYEKWIAELKEEIYWEVKI